MRRFSAHRRHPGDGHPPDTDLPAPAGDPGQSPTPTQRRRWWVAVGALVAVLGAAGVWQMAAAGGGTSPPPAVPTTAAEVSPSVQPSPSPPEPPPSLEIMTSETDDWEAVVRAYLDYHEWLLRNPDPALLDRIVHPDCDCFQEEFDQLAEYQRRGLRWAGEHRLVIHSVESIIDPGAPADDPRELNSLHVQVVLEFQGTDRLLDPSGRTVESSPPDPPRLYDLIFVRGDSGRWRLRVAHDFGPAEGIDGQ